MKEKLRFENTAAMKFEPYSSCVIYSQEFMKDDVWMSLCQESMLFSTRTLDQFLLDMLRHLRLSLRLLFFFDLLFVLLFSVF